MIIGYWTLANGRASTGHGFPDRQNIGMQRPCYCSAPANNSGMVGDPITLKNFGDNEMKDNIPCESCGVLILPSTAAKTGGVCMPCKNGHRQGIEESKTERQREKNTPQKSQENLTGFIVEVRTKDQISVTYQYAGTCKTLKPNQTFVGYFWQMTEKQDDGTFKKAHIQEIQLIDMANKLFSYGKQAVFAVDQIVISILALRGPDSNNRYLSEEFNKYETWNSV